MLCVYDFFLPSMRTGDKQHSVKFFSFVLDRHQAADMLFCFRWFLIHFKREFPFDDIYRLWEVQKRFSCQYSISRYTKSTQVYDRLCFCFVFRNKVIWSEHYGNKFHLIISIAILQMNKTVLVHFAN